MSYILDALKKAERERGMTRLPVLSAAQDLHGTHRHRMAFIVGGIVVCGAAVLWLFLPVLTKVIRPPISSPVQLDSGPRGSAPEIQGTPASMPLETEAPPQPESPHPANLGSMADTDTPPSPDSRAKAGSDAAQQPTAPASRNVPGPTPVIHRGEGPTASSAAAPTQVLTTEEDHPRTDQVPSQSSTNTGSTGTKEAESLSRPEQGKPVPLKEAVSKMTLTLIMYSEVESDRFIFINGRRYAKGDHVDDVYLVESITLEGAVLSYEGEKVLLRR
jgi:general secretion pathway protein B